MFEARRNKVDDKPKMHLQVIYVWFAVSSLCFTVHVKATVWICQLDVNASTPGTQRRTNKGLQVYNYEEHKADLRSQWWTMRMDYARHQV